MVPQTTGSIRRSLDLGPMIASIRPPRDQRGSEGMVAAWTGALKEKAPKITKNGALGEIRTPDP